jgi:dipeptidyl aminopeptidase/acylaminoacyl peptidase
MWVTRRYDLACDARNQPGNVRIDEAATGSHADRSRSPAHDSHRRGHSPLTFPDRVTTPLLIQDGEIDPRVPIAGAWKFYKTLKAMGKTVELDIYPRGGHVLREPMQQREQMRRNLE